MRLRCQDDKYGDAHLLACCATMVAKPLSGMSDRPTALVVLDMSWRFKKARVNRQGRDRIGLYIASWRVLSGTTLSPLAVRLLPAIAHAKGSHQFFLLHLPRR